MTFTTEGLPGILAVPAPLGQLPIPGIGFPGESKVKPLTNAQKLSKALKVCDKRSKRQRAGCERRARRKYGR